MNKKVGEEYTMIQGIHHIALKCCNDAEYQKVLTFYRDVLGLSVARTWEHGIMFDTGCGIVEVFTNAEDSPVYPARIAFCYGPIGEEIEFFQER